MTAMVSNQLGQQIQPINSAQLVGVFKAIVPRSFEKTFDGMPTEAINNAMKICIDGLTREQINFGLSQVRDNGFCPDLAMFRKWCLGITGFGTEQQRTADTYKGKNAALSNILAWLANCTHVITNAEKEAYNRSYMLFHNLNWAANYGNAEYQAHASFKENYIEVVKELTEQGICQCIHDEDLALTNTQHEKPIPIVDEVPIVTHESMDRIKELTKKYVDQGMNIGQASVAVMKELRGGV